LNIITHAGEKVYSIRNSKWLEFKSFKMLAITIFAPDSCET
jgi:hypothetical protein